MSINVPWGGIVKLAFYVHGRKKITSPLKSRRMFVGIIIFDSAYSLSLREVSVCEVAVLPL
jgi:hypothetical protein